MKEAGKSRWYWLVQALSGALLILLVGAHQTAQHFLAAGRLRTYAEVVAYLQQPVAIGLELMFLIVVTVHALLGVRAILGDLGFSARLQQSIDRALWMVGFITVLYGLQLTWQVIQQ
jgi:succinate dehydrogenase hydrophobic anchor subunit